MNMFVLQHWVGLTRIVGKSTSFLCEVQPYTTQWDEAGLDGAATTNSGGGDKDERVSGSLLVLARTRRDKGARCNERMKKTEGWREGGREVGDEEEPEGALRRERESKKEGEVGQRSYCLSTAEEHSELRGREREGGKKQQIPIFFCFVQYTDVSAEIFRVFAWRQQQIHHICCFFSHAQLGAEDCLVVPFCSSTKEATLEKPNPSNSCQHPWMQVWQ